MTVYDALRAAVAAWAKAHGYALAADAFSFDAEPHAEARAYYVAPPTMHAEGYIGGGALVTGRFAIWLAADAGTDAAGAAARLTADLGRLGAAVLRADLGADTNTHDRWTVDVQPRPAGGVTVVGALRITADWEQADGG